MQREPVVTYFITCIECNEVDKASTGWYGTERHPERCTNCGAPLPHGCALPRHIGKYFGRAFDGTFSGRRERAFADQWLQLNMEQPMLSYLNEQPTRELERDAATLVQWLGSNVGMCFLQEALQRFGACLLWPDEVQRYNNSRRKKTHDDPA